MQRRSLIIASIASALSLTCVEALAIQLFDLPERVLSRKRNNKEWIELITAAGKRHNWQVIDKKPGCLRLKYNKRNTYMLTVDVFYKDDCCWIRYVDSFGLDYTPPKNKGDTAQIHRAYSRWVRNLDKAIYTLDPAF